MATSGFRVRLATLVAEVGLCVTAVVAQDRPLFLGDPWPTTANLPSQLHLDPERVAELLWVLRDDAVSRGTWSETRKKALAERPTSPWTLPEVPVWVGDHQWIDFDRDGTFELVAAVSTSPNGIFNQTIFVSRTSSGLVSQTISTAQSETVVIRDVDNDGDLEVVISSEYARGSGAHRVIFPLIYEWSGTAAIDASARYAPFYRSLLPQARVALAKAEADRAAGSQDEFQEEWIAGRQMILDRILRLSGEDPGAPARRVAQWLDEPKWLHLAELVIHANPGPESERQLARLKLLKVGNTTIGSRPQ